MVNCGLPDELLLRLIYLLPLEWLHERLGLVFVDQVHGELYEAVARVEPVHLSLQRSLYLWLLFVVHPQLLDAELRCSGRRSEEGLLGNLETDFEAGAENHTIRADRRINMLGVCLIIQAL